MKMYGYLYRIISRLDSMFTSAKKRSFPEKHNLFLIFLLICHGQVKFVRLSNFNLQTIFFNLCKEHKTKNREQNMLFSLF